MHIVSVNLHVRAEKHSEALRAIDGFIHRLQSWPGCSKCRLLADTGDSLALTLISEWVSREALDSFLASRELLLLQRLYQLLRNEPEILLDEILLRSRLSLGPANRS
jgi:quinol monooxygenase YgiN